MKALIDTCVILDVLEKREPFFTDSKKVLIYVAEGKIEGYITACILKDIYYLVHRYNHDKKIARDAVNTVINLFNILDVTKDDIVNALAKDSGDFEDATIVESALRNGIDIIITRNTSDYLYSSIKAIEPSQIN